MMRYEFKYLVPVNKIDALRQRLRPFVQEDTFAGRQQDHQYTVRSIYYESPGFRSYNEKLAGVERRFKLRIRGYNQCQPESTVFLEVKRKYGVFISKNRAPVLWSTLPLLLKDHDVDRHIIVKRGFEAGQADAHHFFYHLITKHMQPAIHIAYEREAFFTTFDRRIRITFDKNIRFRQDSSAMSLFMVKGLLPLYRNHFVFELKFHESLPEWLADILTSFGLQRSAISKYALSLGKAWQAGPMSVQTAGSFYR